jgi:hypothetical protein
LLTARTRSRAPEFKQAVSHALSGLAALRLDVRVASTLEHQLGMAI